MAIDISDVQNKGLREVFALTERPSSDHWSVGSVTQEGEQGTSSVDCSRRVAPSVDDQRGEMDVTEKRSSIRKGDEPATCSAFAGLFKECLKANMWRQSLRVMISHMERPKPVMSIFTGESRKEFLLFMRCFIGYLGSNPGVTHSTRLKMLITVCTGELKESLISYT